MPGWLLTAVTIAIVLWLTLARTPLPDNDLPAIPGLDKVVHAVMFAGVTAVLWLDWRMACRHRLSRWQASACALAAVALGGLIEMTQDAMGMGRTADMADFIADIIGGAGMLAAIGLWLRSSPTGAGRRQ